MVSGSTSLAGKTPSARASPSDRFPASARRARVGICSNRSRSPSSSRRNSGVMGRCKPPSNPVVSVSKLNRVF
jgi:hypothetical protein